MTNPFLAVAMQFLDAAKIFRNNNYNIKDPIIFFHFDRFESLLRGLCDVSDLDHCDYILEYIFVTLGQMRSDTENEELRKVSIDFESILNGDFLY